MRKCITILALVGFVSTFGSYAVKAEEVFTMHGGTDCGNWHKSRQVPRDRLLLSYGLWGFLSGRQTREPFMNFWFSKKGKVSREQSVLWIDKYCRENPLSDIYRGAMELFNSHATQWIPPK